MTPTAARSSGAGRGTVPTRRAGAEAPAEFNEVGQGRLAVERGVKQRPIRFRGTTHSAELAWS